MIKLEKLLAENMRRFGTKNLREGAMAFEGDPISGHPFFDQTIVVDLDGKKMELLFSNKPYDMTEVDALASKENAKLPTFGQLDSLSNLVMPGYTVGTIWYEMSYDSEMENYAMERFRLYDLSNKSDVQVVVPNMLRKIESDALVLLRPADADYIMYINKKETND
jgi:hypothetical protein